jgi:hypothetical protein
VTSLSRIITAHGKRIADAPNSTALPEYVSEDPVKEDHVNLALLPIRLIQKQMSNGTESHGDISPEKEYAFSYSHLTSIN